MTLRCIKIQLLVPPLNSICAGALKRIRAICAIRLRVARRPVMRPFDNWRLKFSLLCLLLLAMFAIAVPNDSSGVEPRGKPGKVPTDIQAVMSKALYKNAVWGLRV